MQTKGKRELVLVCRTLQVLCIIEFIPIVKLFAIILYIIDGVSVLLIIELRLCTILLKTLNYVMMK